MWCFFWTSAGAVGPSFSWVVGLGEGTIPPVEYNDIACAPLFFCTVLFDYLFQVRFQDVFLTIALSRDVYLLPRRLCQRRIFPSRSHGSSVDICLRKNSWGVPSTGRKLLGIEDVRVNMHVFGRSGACSYKNNKEAGSLALDVPD